MRLASSSPDGSFVCRVDSKPPQPRSSPGVGAPSPVSERKAATGRLGSNRFATSASVARNQARLMDALGAWRGPSLDDRNVDLVQEGIDVGLPVGPQADSTLTNLWRVGQQLVLAVPAIGAAYKSRPLSFSIMKSINRRPRIGNWRPNACSA